MDDGEYFLFDIQRMAVGRDSRDAYNSLYEAQDLEQIRSFYLWLMDLMRLPAGSTLLDVSCGAGALVRLATEAGIHAVGIDVSEVIAHVAHSCTKGMIAVAAGEHLPLADASFDYVTSIGSLEHFVEPLVGAKEMARVLRPGGKAFILVPNTFSLLTNIWIAFRTGRTCVDDQPIQRYGARADWEALMWLGGLVVQKTLKYERSWPRLAADWGYYLSQPKEFLRLLVSPFVPLNLAFCFLYVCERRW